MHPDWGVELRFTSYGDEWLEEVYGGGGIAELKQVYNKLGTYGFEVVSFRKRESRPEERPFGRTNYCRVA